MSIERNDIEAFLRWVDKLKSAQAIAQHLLAVDDINREADEKQRRLDGILQAEAEARERLANVEAAVLDETALKRGQVEAALRNAAAQAGQVVAEAQAKAERLLADARQQAQAVETDHQVTLAGLVEKIDAGKLERAALVEELTGLRAEVEAMESRLAQAKAAAQALLAG